MQVHCRVFFKSSTITYKKFKDSQLTETKYSLKQEVVTRWNTALLMKDRILETHEAINKTLLNLLKAPQPFTADSKVTVSLNIPITCGLLNNLESRTKNLLTETGLKANEFLIDCAVKRLYKHEERTVTRISTLIDPRFQKEGFRSQNNAENAEKLLIEVLIYLGKTPAPTSEPPTPIEQPKTTRHPLTNVNINIENLPKTKRSDAIVDLHQYITKHHSSEDVDPLKYWQHNDSRIKDVMPKYLCIPASSME